MKADGGCKISPSYFVITSLPTAFMKTVKNSVPKNPRFASAYYRSSTISTPIIQYITVKSKLNDMKLRMNGNKATVQTSNIFTKNPNCSYTVTRWTVLMNVKKTKIIFMKGANSYCLSLYYSSVLKMNKITNNNIYVKSIIFHPAKYDHPFSYIYNISIVSIIVYGNRHTLRTWYFKFASSVTRVIQYGNTKNKV